MCGARKRRTPGLLDEALKQGEDSLLGEVAEEIIWPHCVQSTNEGSIARAGPYTTNVGWLGVTGSGDNV